MAKIEGLRIKNFRALKDVTLGRLWNQQHAEPLTPMTAVIGKNGVGKSTLFDAFGFIADALKSGVEDQRKEAVFEQVRKMAGTPEFIWTSSESCASCVDMDKLILLKNRTSYKGFWKDISLLKVSRVYPAYTGECTLGSYPECNSITLVQGDNYESYESFVSLCRYDGEIGGTRCEMGKIIMGFEGVK